MLRVSVGDVVNVFTLKGLSVLSKQVQGQRLILSCNTVVCKDILELQIVQEMWLGLLSKAPIGQLKFIEN